MATYQQLPTRTPQQMGILNQLLERLGSGGGLNQGLDYLLQLLSGDPEAMQAFEAPAMRQFQEQILPNIAEQFGALGAQRSSGFQQTLAGAGERLAENLAAQRAGLQQNALQQLLGLTEFGLGQQPFGYVQKQKRPGFLSGIGGILGGGLGLGLGGGISRLLGGL